MPNSTILVTSLSFVLVALFLSNSKRRNRSSIPRVGRAGPIGYAWTVLRSVLDSDGLVEEGWEQFGGKPFILPSMSGEWIVLGPEDVEMIRKSDDSVFNAPMRAKQLFQPNIMFGDITSNPYHLETIIRSDLTKALKSLVPEMLEEAQLTIPEKLKFPDATDSVTVPLFETMIGVVARVSNRAMIGAPGCRNEKFLKRQVSVAEQAIPMSQVLNWFPQFCRAAVWKLFSMTAGSKDEAVRLLTPYVVERIKYAQQDNPQVITDLLLRYAPEEDLNHPEKLTIRVVHLNMASIHTSSIFTTHCLFALARMQSDEIDAIRTEITEAIQSEGGICNKTAVDKFYMLDSLLKEIGRYQSLFAVGSSRLVLHDAVTADGTAIPAGSVVSFAPKPLHKNPRSYNNPEVFDPFRFSRLRHQSQSSGGPLGANDSSHVKHSFTALSNDYIVFGIGKHACPGRFFAALKVKVILAEIVLNYDLSFPEGASRDPKPFAFNIFTVPSPTAKLTFTKRKASTAT